MKLRWNFLIMGFCVGSIADYALHLHGAEWWVFVVGFAVAFAALDWGNE